jgi:hypothetical protein
VSLKDVVDGWVLTILWEPRKAEENHVADLTRCGHCRAIWGELDSTNAAFLQIGNC